MSSSVFVTAESHCVEISTTLCQDLKIAIQCKLTSWVLEVWVCTPLSLSQCCIYSSSFLPVCIFQNDCFNFGGGRGPSVQSLFATLWIAHARPPCPSPTLELTRLNLCLLSRWCHSTISSSVVRLQSFLASGSFPRSHFFTSGGQVLEFQLQHQSIHWYSGLISFRMDWLDLLAVQGTLQNLLQHHSTTAPKHQFLDAQLSLQSNSHIHTWLLSVG